VSFVWGGNATRLVYLRRLLLSLHPDLTMPWRWRCPACSTEITHGLNDEMPRPGIVYHCVVCRLELTLDETTNRLTVAPLPDPPPKPEGV
jgi:hypothetical protein